MKKTLAYILLTLTVVACSTSDGTFRLKGKFKNFNQGELFVYTLTGKAKIDTVQLMEGRFTYEVPLEDTVVLSVVFPNFSEIPVIAIPGKTVKMEGDASHLREVKVTGTDENDELTDFRLQVSEQTPPEAVKSAENFISEHAESPASIFVLNKYFLLKADADYRKAGELLKKMQKATPGNRQTAQLCKQVAGMSTAHKKDRLPTFSAYTMTGRRITNADLRGDVNVVLLWAAWNYESQGMQRQLRQLKTKYGQRLQILSISIDGNPAECKTIVQRDSVNWSMVCDGQMWATPIVGQLGFYAVPSVVVTDRTGRIIARQLTTNDLKEEIEKRLNASKPAR